MNGKELNEVDNMKKTLKEIYGWDYIDKPDTSLLKHVNAVLSKTSDELNVDDVCMLIRQEMFLDISIPLAIKMIEENHSVGDYYDYCLLVNLSKMDSPLIQYGDSILKLVTVLENDFKGIEFELESDKDDYLESIERLKEKVNNHN